MNETNETYNRQQQRDLVGTRDTTGKIFVEQSAMLGSTAGSALVGLAGANITAANIATASSAATAASLAHGAFAGFAIPSVTHPAIWAIVLTTHPIAAIGGLTMLGAYGGYKVSQFLLNSSQNHN